MTKGQWGMFYLVSPDASADDEGIEDHVVRTYRYGPSNARIAEELWRLAGDATRADKIASVLERAHERPVPTLDLTDIAEILGALEGIEEHVGRALLDGDGVIRADKVSDVRRRSEFLTLDAEAPTAPYAVINAFARVAALCVALREAQQQGLYIAMD